MSPRQYAGGKDSARLARAFRRLRRTGPLAQWEVSFLSRRLAGLPGYVDLLPAVPFCMRVIGYQAQGRNPRDHRAFFSLIAGLR